MVRNGANGESGPLGLRPTADGKAQYSVVASRGGDGAGPCGLFLASARIRRAGCRAIERLDLGGVAVPPPLGLALGSFGRSSRSTSAYRLGLGRFGDAPVSETDGGRRAAARLCGEWVAASDPRSH
jgi:hypothetical protein